jgi:hypothetical protein
MSNEIQLSITATLNKPASMSAAISRSMLNLLRNQTGNYSSYGQLTCSSGTAASSNQLAIPLQGLAPSTTQAPVVGQPHFAWFENMDLTNFVRIYDRNVGSAGVIAQLAPGDIAMIPLYANCLPYAIGEAGAPVLEYFIMGY